MLIKYFKQMDHTWKHSQHVNSVPSLVEADVLYEFTKLSGIEWLFINDPVWQLWLMKVT